MSINKFKIWDILLLKNYSFFGKENVKNTLEIISYDIVIFKYYNLILYFNTFK